MKTSDMEAIELYRAEPQKFITRRKAASILRCAVVSISRYAAAGRVRAVRLGPRRMLVYEPDVWALLREL